ncbi:MAG TPA: helix-turn-helix domain-containing protein [Allosphingosinicella sp.]|jgi:excisionase family DNA binding protein
MRTTGSGAPSEEGASTLPLTVRVKEACRLTGIGRSKLYLLMKEGEIETIKVGSMTLIPMRSLEVFLHLERFGGPDGPGNMTR